MYSKQIELIVGQVKNNSDCRFLVFGVNAEGGIEHCECYTYLQCNEAISDMKHMGYTNIKKIKI